MSEASAAAMAKAESIWGVLALRLGLTSGLRAWFKTLFALALESYATEREAAVWEAALSDVAFAQEVTREEMVAFKIEEREVMAKFCKGFEHVLDVLARAFRARAAAAKEGA
jgi:hypothetical protein